MKVLVACTVLIAVVLAEPPVDNRYLPPGQGFNGGYSQPSQNYGPPGASGFAPQRQTDAVFGSRQSNFNAPRSRPSSSYGAPRNSRPTNQYLPPQSQPSSQYGAPPQFSRNDLSNQYNAPQRNAPSSQYGAPQRNAPSSQYGAPQRNAPSSQYGAPQRNAPPSQYGAPQRNAPSSQYGAPQRNAPSSQYNAPLAAPERFNSQSQFPPQSNPSSQYLPPSGQYGAPVEDFGRQRRPSEQYGAPVPSGEYGAPGFDNGAGQQSSFGGNQRDEQSRQYLPPAGRGGYPAARGGYDDDEANNEPANYSFEYMVKDDPSGNDFGHRESRMGDRAEGLYYVLLPDGRKQTVEYEADQDGYKPRISYEDVGIGAGGYDSDSQSRDLTGPY